VENEKEGIGKFTAVGEESSAEIVLYSNKSKPILIMRGGKPSHFDEQEFDNFFADLDILKLEKSKLRKSPLSISMFLIGYLQNTLGMNSERI